MSSSLCPICLGNQGIENEHTLLNQADLVYRDELATVWLNSFWIPGNEGHVIIVPNAHYENLYELPKEEGYRIFELSQVLAKSLKKAYHCDGITLRQNNEPAGDQHAFHYHLHVFPRYEGDQFNERMTQKSVLSEPSKRLSYVRKLQAALGVEHVSVQN